METQRRVEAWFDVDRAGDTEWLVEGATLHERLNEPYILRLDVVTPEAHADATALSGSPCSLVLERRQIAMRVCGIVTKVREGTDAEQQTHASLVVEPALAALRHRRDSRIFQNQTVPEILREILEADLGPFGRSIELRLEGDYPPREYTVQYRETDFDLVHRLMEEEGIGYGFEHDGSAEVMVLFDRPAHAASLEGEQGSTLPYRPRMDEGMDDTEAVSRFERITRVRPNRFVARHFDWTHPSVAMESGAEVADEAWPTLETYEHDAPVTFSGYDHTYGEHNAPSQLQLSAERARRDANVTDGTSSALGIRAGRKFELTDHPRGELDRDWTVVETEHRYLGHTSDEGSQTYANRFLCLPADVAWRPDRVRDRPRILGVQTATVVGPAGEEIHCDPHGRVKVQFHWDRLGSRDDHSSCWIRVMQAMGGPGWGFSFIPRIGMEVVVTFVEGDPDRPLVTGVVYNAENPPPYDYPADKTRTTIKSNSSPGGGGFNELRFEDRAGQEEIWLHGEKDWNTLIKHDLTRTVGNNEAQEVVVDRSRKVGNDEQVEIGNSRTKRVQVDETEVVGSNRTREVGQVESITVGIDRVKNVGSNETVTIGNDASQSIGASLTQTIGQNALQSIALNAVQNVGASASRNVVMNDALQVGGEAQWRVGLNLTQKVGQDLSQDVKGSASTSVGASRNVTVKATDTLQVGAARNVTVGAISAEQVGLMKRIDAGQSITLACGDSSIELKADGTITIKGKKVVIDGADAVNVTGGIINLN